jgi:hypothetical protein
MDMLAFERIADRPGFEVVDRLEQQRYRVHTPDRVDLDPVATDAFRFPVGEAASFETGSLELPTVVGVYIRDGEGTMVTEVEHLESVSLPEDTYILELSTQLKTYIEVESSLAVDTDLTQTRIDFGSAARVHIGVRSRHERPAATVTTPPEPHDVMAALETFGSALKTLDPERSYPTLRGHPPAVELGDDLHVPDGVGAPETGITLEVPPNFESILPIAPLAFYLGASVAPGPTPKLVTDTGFEYILDGPRGYETVVAETLQQVFFFDCLTRTEGYYEIDLHERAQVEPLVDLDFAAMYDASLAEQVAAYLEVPFGVVEDHLPDWRLTTHVEPTAETLEQLPFVIDDLAVVKTVGGGHVTPSQPSVGATEALARDDTFTRSAANPSGDTVTRSADQSSTGTDASYVQPDAEGTVEHAWIGDRIPIGASKLTQAAFENRLERDATDGDITITIVVNDPRMEAEGDVVDEAYGDRDELPFDVSVHRETTVDELREVLTQREGYLHYIGHTEHDGFECADGKLDAATLEETSVDAFLLNACNSYHQGLNLIEAGAIGGIVTLVDIINEGAVRMGESIARLLNAGFPLRASLTIARDESVQGGQYIVVGDGGTTLTQADGRTPVLFDLVQSGNQQYDLEIQTHVTDHAGLGSVYMPHLTDVGQYYLSSGVIDRFQVERDELAEFLARAEVPVRKGGSLDWSVAVATDLEGQ